MDFGFGAFLEKFESYFGALATRVLVGLMGAAVVAACLSLIGRLVMSTVHLFDQSTKNRAGDVFLVAQLLALLWAGYTGVESYRRVKRLRREISYLRDAETASKETRATLEDTRELRERVSNETRETLAAAEIILGDIISLAVSRGEFTQEQADLLRSLQGTAPRTQLAPAHGGG